MIYSLLALLALGCSAVQIDEFFDPPTAERLSWLSTMAYCDPNCISSWSCPVAGNFGNFTTTFVFQDQTTDTLGFVGFTVNNGFNGVPFLPNIGVNDPIVIVAFRGTIPSDLENWITDLDAIKTQFGTTSAQVHEGFYEAYQSLYNNGLGKGLTEALVYTQAQAIIFAGHSLGAALATIAALDIATNVAPGLVYGLATQGSPRVGDAVFSQMVTNSIDVVWRQTHNLDTVVHVPLEIMGFQHVPLEFFFDEAFDSFTVCNSSLDGEDDNCADQCQKRP